MASTVPSNYKIYNSTASLSSRISDIANVFVLPPICFTGFLLNLICLIVIMKPELKGEVYTFIMFHSFCDLIFLFINFFTFIIRCGVFCNYGYSFLSKLWELYVHLFIGNSFLLFGTLLDIIVSVNRLSSFSSTQSRIIVRLNKIDFRIKCVILTFISLVANLPSYVITRNVTIVGFLEVPYFVNSNSTTEFVYKELYQALTNSLGKNQLMVTFLFILTLFRGLIPLLFLFLINIFIGYKFRLHIKKKRQVIHTSTITAISEFFLKPFLLLVVVFFY